MPDQSLCSWEAETNSCSLELYSANRNKAGELSDSVEFESAGRPLLPSHVIKRSCNCTDLLSDREFPFLHRTSLVNSLLLQRAHIRRWVKPCPKLLVQITRELACEPLPTPSERSSINSISTNFAHYSVITMCETRSRWYSFCQHIIYLRSRHCRYRGTRHCHRTSSEEVINDFCPDCWERMH